MSRTYRKPPKLKMYKGVKKVKDGTPTKYSHSCENNGGCPYCESNRFHKNNKRLEIIKYKKKEYELSGS